MNTAAITTLHFILTLRILVMRVLRKTRMSKSLKDIKASHQLLHFPQGSLDTYFHPIAAPTSPDIYRLANCALSQILMLHDAYFLPIALLRPSYTFWN